jgi:hypothetical protein
MSGCCVMHFRVSRDEFNFFTELLKKKRVGLF